MLLIVIRKFSSVEIDMDSNSRIVYNTVILSAILLVVIVEIDIETA